MQTHIVANLVYGQCTQIKVNLRHVMWVREDRFALDQRQYFLGQRVSNAE